MTYHTLLDALRTGARIDPATIAPILAAEGRTADDLLADLFSDRPARSGDPCPRCGRRLQVVNSVRLAGRRVRYLGCRGCNFRPPANKWVVPE